MPDSPAQPRTRAELEAMLLPALRTLAGELGITGAGRTKKGDLVQRILFAQDGPGAEETETNPAPEPASRPAPATEAGLEQGGEPARTDGEGGGRRRRRAERPRGGAAPGDPQPQEEARNVEAPPTQERQDQEEARHEERQVEEAQPDERRDETEARGESVERDGVERPRRERPTRKERRERQRERQRGREERTQDGEAEEPGRGPGADRDQGGSPQDDRAEDRYGSDEGNGRRSRRRRRNRDGENDERYERYERPAGGDDGPEVFVAGILDLVGASGMLRTSGYLPGSSDVQVNANLVQTHNLRRGDALSGMARPGRSENGKERPAVLTRVETVNGEEADPSRRRVEFGKLTPLYPDERLRMEKGPGDLTGRVMDIVAPLGKGQRGLIVSPPKAGKTSVLQSIAAAITQNSPECHLMVVLVDERPEEVTDMERSVKGEVISSTFDRPAKDHTLVAELAIERAKRLVELGHDVVVLLDSITRLGRAYNLAAPQSGRILSGGVDASALYPPKRFFGAARNVENGGSLTILATALVETGSTMDTVIFEEFKGTGNMELKLDRRLADKRVFPAVDIDSSGTRKEELLMSKEELAIVWSLRRVLHALDDTQALELLTGKLKETRSNVEFLRQVQRTTPPSGS